MTAGAVDPRGSMWRRWDPHIHAPGTALNDQYGGGDPIGEFVKRLKAADPAIEAVGITDYFGTHCYEEVLKAKALGDLAGVALLFPNVELRLNIGTKRGAGVNIHLLVSPDDPDHVIEIKRFLSRLKFHFNKDTYACTPSELVALGKAHNRDLVSEESMFVEGVNQFKVDFEQLREEFNDSEWMRESVLVAVAGGSNDGTSGIRDEGGTFAAQRKEIENFSDIIFSSSEKQIEFWLGSGELSRAEIERQYRSLKPCLHGSDAHEAAKVGSPDLGRMCWIKGDATFESLKQACIEPERRVHIGSTPGDVISPDHAIIDVSTVRISVNPYTQFGVFEQVVSEAA